MTVTQIIRYDEAHAPTGGGRVRITADRARRWEFGTGSFTRRGYDQADVDRFRMQVADELDLLSTQMATLRAENQRLSDHLEMHRHGVLPSVDPAAKLPAAEEVNLLSAAQREAEQIIAQAHDYAQRVAEYARAQYDSFMQAAVEEAKAEAERAVNDYRTAAGPTFDDTVATREALRIFGEMMISHMQAAAQHLDSGVEQLTRTLHRIANEAATPPVSGGQHAALPHHR